MKDNIDDRMRIKVMPDLGMTLDNLCNTYTAFFNSHDKAERIKLLNDMRNAAIDCERKSKVLLEMFGGHVIEGPLPAINLDLSRRVQNSINSSLHGAYLNLTQLGKQFIWPSNKSGLDLAMEKVQILFQIHTVAVDIADLCLITSAEPEKGLAS